MNRGVQVALGGVLDTPWLPKWRVELGVLRIFLLTIGKLCVVAADVLSADLLEALVQGFREYEMHE